MVIRKISSKIIFYFEVTFKVSNKGMPYNRGKRFVVVFYIILILKIININVKYYRPLFLFVASALLIILLKPNSSLFYLL